MDLEIEAGTLEQRAQDLGVALLVSGARGAVVHAGVADQLLEQLGYFPGQIGCHGRILRCGPPTGAGPIASGPRGAEPGGQTPEGA